MPVKGTYLVLAGAGGIFLWSGIKGKGISDTFRAIVSGKSPANVNTANPFQTASPYSYVYSGTTQTSGSASANQALAKIIAISMGHPDWTAGQQWQDWVSLWNQESGWNQYAQNASSGAYGIPQSLPYTKMPKSAWPSSAGGSSNASAQMSWGISYIGQRYGSPSAAWAHEQANNWY